MCNMCRLTRTVFAVIIGSVMVYSMDANNNNESIASNPISVLPHPILHLRPRAKAPDLNTLHTSSAIEKTNEPRHVHYDSYVNAGPESNFSSPSVFLDTLEFHSPPTIDSKEQVMYYDSNNGKKSPRSIKTTKKPTKFTTQHIKLKSTTSRPKSLTSKAYKSTKTTKAAKKPIKSTQSKKGRATPKPKISTIKRTSKPKLRVTKKANPKKQISALEKKIKGQITKIVKPLKGTKKPTKGSKKSTTMQPELPVVSNNSLLTVEVAAEHAPSVIQPYFPAAIPEPAPGIEIQRCGISKEEKLAVLDKHNEFRLQIAKGLVENQPRGIDLKRLEWDDDLERAAEFVARIGRFEHITLNDERFYYGQNLHIHSSSKESTPDWIRGLTSWFSEHTSYKYGPTIKHDPSGHYTQMIWANTHLVGCSLCHLHDTSKADLKENNLYVCHYGPSGNYIGELPYTVGEVGCDDLC